MVVARQATATSIIFHAREWTNEDPSEHSQSVLTIKYILPPTPIPVHAFPVLLSSSLVLFSGAMDNKNQLECSKY